MDFIDSNTIVEIDRNNMFIDAFNGIMKKSSQELKKRLRITFKEEEGIDAEGLLRYFIIKSKSLTFVNCYKKY